MSDNGNGPQRREHTPELIRDENRSAEDRGYVADERLEGRDRDPPPREQGDEGIERRERAEPTRITSKYADKRNRMLDAARVLREDQSASPELADEIAQSRREAFPTGVDQPEIKKPAEQGEQPGAKRKLKVNGKEIELTEDEIVTQAQRALAADDILDGAKRDRELAQELLRTAQSAVKPAGTPAADEPEPSRAADPAPTSATKLTGVDFAKVINLIQIGTEEEGAKALQEAIGTAIEQAQATAREQLESSLPSQVRSINDVEQRLTKTRSQLEQIYDANPELRTDEIVQNAFVGATASEMKKHIIGAGVKPEKLEEYIRNSRLSPADTIGAVYNQLSREHNLPAHADVVAAAHKALVDRNYLKPIGERPRQQETERRPAPDNSNTRYDPQQRLERKREIAPQPRRAGVIPSSESRDVSSEERGLSAVRQMRAHRRGR
jgi:hypothetical protein